MTTDRRRRVFPWLGRIAAVGAVALLLGSAAGADAHRRHAHPARQERASSDGDKLARASYVGEKTMIQMPTW